MGSRSSRAAHHQRQRRMVLVGVGLEAHGGERREHAAHGPSPQGRIAGEFDLHVVAGDDAEHQPAAGAGIAEIERRGRRAQAAHPLALHRDRAVGSFHLGAKRRHGLGRGQHVFGLEQAGDAGDAGRQRAQDQRAVGDRLVARHPNPAGKARGRACGQRLLHRVTIGLLGRSIAFDSTDVAWQWGHATQDQHRGVSMSKPARGTKRVCPSCGARFYDLSRTPITCPVCQAVYQVTPPLLAPRRARSAG